MINKKKLGIILKVFLVLVIIITGVCSTKAYEDNGTCEYDYRYADYIGIDNDSVYCANVPVIESMTQTSDNQYTVNNRDDFPSVFDPRLTNEVTPIKDQGELKTCVMFASNAVLEQAVYRKTGLKSSFSEDSMRVILSRNLMVQNQITDFSNLAGDYYWNRKADDIRNNNEAIQYLSNINEPIIPGNDSIVWISPNPESVVPYTETIGDTYWPSHIDTYANAHADGIIYIPYDERTIKEAILDNGAVYAQIKTGIYSVFNPETDAYCTPYSPPEHAVAIVGWDDEYKKENFLEGYQPSSDGAWLIKNSWGTSVNGVEYPEHGYIWVSYEDETIDFYPNSMYTITNISKTSKNEYMLSYDFLYMNSNNTDNTYYVGNTGTERSLYICNVYSLSSLNNTYNTIDKVTLYARNIGDTYQVYIKPVDSDGNIPDINTFTTNDILGEGVITSEGFYTVELTDGYDINSNIDRYAIIVRFITTDTHISLAQEEGLNSVARPHTYEYNESYIYTGSGWQDVANGISNTLKYNFCIRPTLVRSTPITQNSTLSNSYASYTGSDISVNVNLNGNQLYSIKHNGDVLYEDRDFTRSGNTVTFKSSFIQSELSSAGANRIYFEFTDGDDAVFTINKYSIANVSFSGTLAKGKTLTASAYSQGFGLNPSLVDYQWMSSSDGVNWSDIAGATNSTYTLTDSDILKYIKVKVSPKSGSYLLQGTVKYSSPSSHRVVLYGDADLNGEVDDVDATYTQRYVNHVITFSDENILAADVDGDGDVTMIDVVLIQRRALNIISSFPVEED